jgi:hypothetical protein
LEKKDKEEEYTKEVDSEEMTLEEAKQVSLSKKDEDETRPIGKLIMKHEVVDPTNKGKVKDHVTNMDGEWVETKMRKMIYGVIFPRVEHPTLA